MVLSSGHNFGETKFTVKLGRGGKKQQRQSYTVASKTNIQRDWSRVRGGLSSSPHSTEGKKGITLPKKVRRQTSPLVNRTGESEEKCMEKKETTVMGLLG